MSTVNERMEAYRQAVNEAEREMLQVKRQIRVIGLTRLVAFVLILWSGYRSVADAHNSVALVVLLVATVFFLFEVKRHARWFGRKRWLNKRLEQLCSELRTFDYDYSAFDSGQSFVDATHPYTYDLDVFGAHSLFQAMNRTTTPLGHSRLAAWFIEPPTSPDTIRERQAVVSELAEAVDFRHDVRTQGMLHEAAEGDLSAIAAWVQQPVYFRTRPLLRVLPWLVMAVNAGVLAGAFCGLLPWSLWGTVFSCFVALSLLFAKQITRVQYGYGKQLTVLGGYAEIMRLLENYVPRSQGMITLREQLKGGDSRSSSAVLKVLSRRLNLLDQRSNLLVSVILNGLALWELYLTLQIEAWKQQNAPHLMRWLETVGELEAYCSLATFAYNHPDYRYPTVRAGEFCLCIDGIGHPLMRREGCVRNGIEMSGRGKFFVITGANMAGKSTYLRAVGVTFLMACMGLPVWADRMEFTPVRLVTGLRTTDSLVDNESYFFAELKRLKRIIDRLEAGEELFVVLDEILKGTNSVDKQRGSLALVKQFVALRTNGIIATHDLLLGGLADAYPQEVSNFCFEADVVDDELHFSYRLRPGVAQNMNACFLMKKMGIAVDY